MDYSIRDALEAGFNKIVFIIRKDLEEEFKSTIGARVSKIAEVAYAYQEMEKLPEGFTKPADRTNQGNRTRSHLKGREFRSGAICSYQCRRLLWQGSLCKGS